MSQKFRAVRIYAIPNSYQNEVGEILRNFGPGYREKKFRVLARREIKKLEKLGKVWNQFEVLNFTNMFVFNCLVVDKTQVSSLTKYYVIGGENIGQVRPSPHERRPEVKFF